VTGLRQVYGIAGTSRTKLGTENVHTADEAAQILGVTHSTVIRWAEVGLVRGSQQTSGAPWRIELTEEDRQRLLATGAPAGWLPLKGAAVRLGVSQKTVLQRLQRGELQGVRVKVGRRCGWRIRVSARTSDTQPTLFDGPRS
jgi:predicted site-specific integrase-resolvase